MNIDRLCLFIFIFYFAYLLIPVCTYADPTVLNNPLFGESLPPASEAKSAWEQGVKLKQGKGQTIKYYLGTIYGFQTGKIPADKDPAVQAKLNTTYASRTEMRNTQRTALFAFNDFDCAALAGYDRLQPDITQCTNVKFTSKFSGIQQGQAFSIVSLPAEIVCACLKALDRTVEGDNSRIFYGDIARNELNRLHQEGNMEELLSFFEKNYKRGIFRMPEILLAAQTYTDKNAKAESLALLNVIIGHFAKELTSEQYELCGDLYYKLGQARDAEIAYANAHKLLNN
jgi:hypothetical protein